MNKIYACIDLKSFYASVECQSRNLDPLTTNLVVADPNRTEKTICLAVSPSLKQYGIPGRARLFEVISKVKEINQIRKRNNNNKPFTKKSYNDNELKSNKSIALSYIIAPPRMQTYIKYSTKIYNTYLKYISKEDIFVYSIDEVFIDLTPYLKTYNLTPESLVTKIIHDVVITTGITATAGIGTNLYLAKIAMDIEAKHMEPNIDGVRIAYLNEEKYRLSLWQHTPLTDFWRIGPGISKKLNQLNLYTMGDIALISVKNEDILYKEFGINAELIIDHAWGYEPCTMKDIKSYKPTTNSLSIGQVLHSPYTKEKTRTIIFEMLESLTLDLVYKKVVTNSIVININYDSSNPITKTSIKDYYGRYAPKPYHRTVNLDYYTNSTKEITKKVLELYEQEVPNNLLIRKINISAISLSKEKDNPVIHKQLDIFNINKEENNPIDKTENQLQNTMINIKKKYGKNSILKGIDYLEEATTIDRNNQIGGHKA